MSLRTKIFAFTAVLVATSILLAAVLVQHQVQRAAVADADENLLTVIELIDELNQTRIQQLRERAEMAARMEPLVDALAQGETFDLRPLLERIAPGLDKAELFAVLSRDGQTLAGSSEIGGEQLSMEPVRSALEGEAASGIWGLGDRLFNLVAVPIPAPGEATAPPLGALILGANVSPMAERLRHVSKSDVVVVADEDRIFGSSMPPTHTRAAARLLPSLYRDPKGALEAKIGGVPYLVRLDQQRIHYGGETCNHIVLRSLEGTTRLTEKVRENLLLVGLFAVPLAFAIAWLGSRQIALPLSRLAEGMLHIARTGSLHHGVAHLGGSHEVQIFQEAFRHMLDSIDESQRARERSYVEAVGAVVAAIDRRDHQSAGHSYRVAFFAVALAQEIGFQGDALRAIEWGALLHDVGKIAVPDAILRKVGPLTDEEWHIMRQHPNWGYEMLADVKFLKPALEIIYNHHERWDGGGYPRGLRGSEIPMSARIFAVVDTYDAITSDRHYRRARSHKAAAQELTRVEGSQLDPAVVEAFLRIPEVELRRLRELANQLDAGLKMPMELADLLTGHQMQ